MSISPSNLPRRSRPSHHHHPNDYADRHATQNTSLRSPRRLYGLHEPVNDELDIPIVTARVPPPSPVKGAEKENMDNSLSEASDVHPILRAVGQLKPTPLDFAQRIEKHEHNTASPISLSHTLSTPGRSACDEAAGSIECLIHSLFGDSGLSPGKGCETGGFAWDDVLKSELENTLLNIAQEDDVLMSSQKVGGIDGGSEVISSKVTEGDALSKRVDAGATRASDGAVALTVVGEDASSPAVNEPEPHSATTPPISPSTVAYPQYLNADGKRPADEDGGRTCYYKHDTVDFTVDIVVQVDENTTEVRHPPKEFEVEEVAFCQRTGTLLPVGCADEEEAVADLERKSQSKKRRCPSCFKRS